MSPIEVAATITEHAAKGLASRWTKCGRNFRRFLGFIGTLSTVVGLCTALYAQGLMPASQSYVHDEIGKQVAPMTVAIDMLHRDVSALQSDLIKLAAAPPNFDLLEQLRRIEAKLDDVKKAPLNKTSPH
jgi:hypothetical protein